LHIPNSGWEENEDIGSDIFQLKWVTKIKDIDFGALKDNQIVNHFQGNGCFTTKLGLCKNIRSLILKEKTDIETFLPRSYDLLDILDFEDFIEDFKYTLVLSFQLLFSFK